MRVGTPPCDGGFFFGTGAIHHIFVKEQVGKTMFLWVPVTRHLEIKRRVRSLGTKIEVLSLSYIFIFGNRFYL